MLDFGPASGGYACVFFGWTALYAFVALWRRLLDRDPGREPLAVRASRASTARCERACPARTRLLRAGIEACSFYWAYFVAHRRDRVRRPLPGLRPGLARTGRFEPPLVYVAIAGLLYGSGACGRRAGARLWIRETAGVRAGLATIVIALDSPIDYYTDQLFWVHMGQHILLLTVAPPLILLGRPWPRMWRALPLEPRTQVGRTLAGARWTAPIRALARPLPAWMLFNANIWSGTSRRPTTSRCADSAIHMRARAVLLHRPAVLGPRDRPGTAAAVAGTGRRRWPT